MVQSVLATEPKHPQGHVANGCRGDLSVDQVALHQRILEQGYHRVDVIFAHLANVFEEKRHGLKKKTFKQNSQYNSIEIEKKDKSAGVRRKGQFRIPTQFWT